MFTKNAILSATGRNACRHQASILAAMALGALTIRLCIIFAFETYRFPDEKSFGAEMGWIARNLVEGNGFTVSGPGETVYYAWMAPLFPFLLSTIFGIFGSYSISSAVAVLIMQSIISSMVVIPLYLCAKEIYDGKVALIAAALWLIHPGSMIFAAEVVWSSSLTALGLATAFWILVKLHKHPKFKVGALVGGVVIGLTSLSDPTAMAIVPAGAIWLIWHSRSHLKEVASQVAIIGLATILVITPWTIRNYAIFGQFVPIKSTLGVNLWQGNHAHNINQPTAGIGFWDHVEENFSEEEITFLVSLNEVERAKIFLDEAIAFISANPATFIYYTVWRIYLFWRIFILGISGMFLLPYYLLIAVGFVMSKQQWKYTTLLVLFFAIFPIPYYLSIMDTYRYRFPVEVLLLLPLAYSIGRLAPLAHDFVSGITIKGRKHGS